MLVIFYCTAFLNDVKGWQKRCLDSKKRSPNIQEMLLKDIRAIYHLSVSNSVHRSLACAPDSRDTGLEALPGGF